MRSGVENCVMRMMAITVRVVMAIIARITFLAMVATLRSRTLARERREELLRTRDEWYLLFLCVCLDLTISISYHKNFNMVR